MELVTANIQLGDLPENAASLASEVLLASLFAATLLAEVCADRLPGKTFVHRFGYAYWRYALPACLLSGFVYWLLWGRFNQ